jgi:hypothetical protein
MKTRKFAVRTPSERNNLLKAYFEPTFEEKENGLKLPMVFLGVGPR